MPQEDRDQPARAETVRPVIEDPIEAHRRTLEWAGSKVAGAGTDLGLSTPCGDWDLATLLFHVVAGLSFFEEMARSGRVDDPTALPLPDFTSAAPAVAFNEAAKSSLEEWSIPGRLDQTCQMPFGPMPGRQALGIHTADLLVHGWDIATAAGLPAEVDADLCDYALGVERALITSDMRSSGAFGPELEAPHGATAQERLLAFVGRPWA